MLRIIGKQSGESVESVLKLKKERLYDGKDLQKRKVKISQNYGHESVAPLFWPTL